MGTTTITTNIHTNDGPIEVDSSEYDNSPVVHIGGLLGANLFLCTRERAVELRDSLDAWLLENLENTELVEEGSE